MTMTIEEFAEHFNEFVELLKIEHPNYLGGLSMSADAWWWEVKYLDTSIWNTQDDTNEPTAEELKRKFIAFVTHQTDSYYERLPEAMKKETGVIVNSEGDRYNGYSVASTETLYTFSDGAVLSVTDYYEPGDMFCSSDSWTSLKLIKLPNRSF